MRLLTPYRFADVDHLMDQFLRATVPQSRENQPAGELQETKENFLLSFDLPGVKKEDIKIALQNNKLTISGERRFETRARGYGKFERSIALPVTVDADKVEAHHENGVLYVVLPKSESAKGRTVEIQAAGEGFLTRFLEKKEEAIPETTDTKVS